MEEKKKKIDKGTIIIIGITAIIVGVCIIIISLNNNSKGTYSTTNTSSNYQKSSNNSNTTSNTSYSQVEKQKIALIDFSSMSKDEIKEWCNQNKITYNFTNEYSEYIEKDGFIRQSIKSGDYVYENEIVTIVYSLGKKPTIEQSNALKKAQSYAKTMHMSKQGIYDQLVSEYGEGFTEEAAQYAIDNINVDWNANALAKAKSYQTSLSMSKKAIYEQLISAYGEQFTEEEAQYAIDHLED